MAPLPDHQVAVFARPGTRVTTTCPNGTRTSRLVSGYQTVEVTAGCEASNDRFVFRGRRDEGKSVQITYATRWNLSDVEGLDRKQLDHIKQRLRERARREETQGDDLTGKVLSMEDLARGPGLLGLANSALILLLYALLIWRCTVHWRGARQAASGPAV
jgi:hypothetical protein